MNAIEKQAFADEAEKALDHALVRSVIREFADNMGFELEGLPKYGIMKVAMYVATVARAQALGIDPDELRQTPQEATAATIDRMLTMMQAGVPIVVVDAVDEQEQS